MQYNRHSMTDTVWQRQTLLSANLSMTDLMLPILALIFVPYIPFVMETSKTKVLQLPAAGVRHGSVKTAKFWQHQTQPNYANWPMNSVEFRL